jgi:hypothetical protein
MDVRYRGFEDATSESNSEILARPLVSDFKALRPDAVNFATSARGSCGNNPGPAWLRIVTLSMSSMGDGLDGVRKRLVSV